MKVYDMFGAMPARKQRRMDDGLLSNPRGLSGLSDDYTSNVNSFKDILAKLNKAASDKEAQARAGQETYHAPQTPEYRPPPPPPTPREGAIGPEMNLPPLQPAISVNPGDEVPPPFPVMPKMPGVHPPVVTGIFDPNDRYYPPNIPPLPPDPETSACGPGYTRTAPGGPCLKNTPTGENYGAACYSCGGSMKWTSSPGAGCIPTGYDEATCKASGGGVPALPYVPSYGAAPVTPSVMAPPDTSSYTSFAGGGMDGIARLRRMDGMGAPAFSRPIKLTRKLW
jgi:hypothetical protein